MVSLNEQKTDLKRNISEMKQGSIEQMLLIVKYGLAAYFKSVIMFGSESSVTQDNIQIIKEMFEILKRERKLLNYILINIDCFDIDAAEDVVGMLDKLNDDTIDYYYRLIDDIEDAAETGQEFRGYRPRKEAKTLITDDSYLSEVIALGIKLDDLKKYLGYEDEFWDFLKGRVKIVDTSTEIMEKMVRVTPITDNGEIVDIDLLVPRVHDLSSATLAIEIYEKAYSLYRLIGNRVEEYKSSDSNEIKERYVYEYLPMQAKEMLKIKNVS